MFCRALIGVLSLMLAASAVPAVFAEAGTDSVIEIMPFQDFGSSYDADQWDSYADWTKFPAPANGRLEAARTGDGFYAADWPYPEEFKTKLNARGVKKIVILGTMRLENVGGRMEISLVDSPNNAGGSPIQALFDVYQNAPRLRCYDRSNTNIPELGREIELPFTGDVAAVIDIAEDGKTGQATYYYNGARMKNTAETVIPSQTITLDGTTHIRLSLHNVSAGAFDNVEAFALTADNPAVQYSGLTTAGGDELPAEGLAQNSSFALKFESPIILGALEGAIAINGEIVSMDRISLSADRRSVIVAAPFGGYRGDTQTVTVSRGGIKSYTGGTNADIIKETVSIFFDPNAHRADIIPYQDFAEDADEAALLASGVWDNASVGDTADVLEATGGNLLMTKDSGVRTLNKEIDLSAVEDGTQLVVLARMQTMRDGGSVKDALTTYNQWGANTACSLVEVNKGVDDNGIWTGAQTGGVNQNKAEGMTVELNQWYDTAAVLTFHRTGMDNPTADIEYYVNGVNTGTGVTDVSPITGSGDLAAQLSMYVKNGGGAFDDIEAYFVIPGETTERLTTELAEQPFADESGAAITSVYEEESFVIRFNNPVMEATVADKVSINGQSVNAALTADRRGLLVEAPADGWTGSSLNISIAGGIKGYAATDFEGTTLTLPVSKPPAPVYGQKQAMAAYDAEGEFRTSDWDFNMNTESGYVVNQDGRMQMRSPEYTTMVAVFKDYPDQFVKAMSNGTEAYLIIRAGMTVESTIQDDAPTHTELRRMAIELTNRTNNSALPNRRLAWLGVEKESDEANLYVPAETAGSGSPTRLISGPFDLGEWVQVDIVLHMKGVKSVPSAAADATYYVNGVKAAEIKDCSLGNDVNNINGVRFVAINNVVGAFDYIEAYSVVGGAQPFSYSDMAGENGSAADSISPNEGVVLNFTSDMAEITDDFTENGEPISADRISVAADGNHIVIAPPAGGWEAQKDYTIRSGRKLTDIMGTRIESPVSANFKTGGGMLSAAVTSVSRSGDSATAALRLRNVNSVAKDVKVIIAEYTGADDTIMLKNDNPKLVTLQPNQTIEENISLSGLSADSMVQVFVWEAEDNNPVLDRVYVIE